MKALSVDARKVHKRLASILTLANKNDTYWVGQIRALLWTLDALEEDGHGCPVREKTEVQRRLGPFRWTSVKQEGIAESIMRQAKQLCSDLREETKDDPDWVDFFKRADEVRKEQNER